MSTDKLRQQFKGQLYKYTNVVKGWQYRWFILDPDTGILDYYVSLGSGESQRKQRPRGSVHLAAAVISPSDEDSSTFTVNSATGEVFKLQASDARERQEWVNRLRAVAEMHTMAIAQSNPPLPPREHHSVLPLPHAAAVPTVQGRRVHCTLAVLDAFKTAREHLQKAEQSNQALAQFIDNLPSSGSVSNVDPDLLVLKATSQATITCLAHCLSILQQQQIAAPTQRTHQTQQPATVKKLPPTSQSHFSDPLDRKSVSDSASISTTVSSDLQKMTVSPPEAEDEITDSESDTDLGHYAYEEHNTLLRLASHTKRGTDLTRVFLPTFLMEPRSLLEALSDFFGHAHLFTKIPEHISAQDRMVAVLKWYLTSFHLGLNFQQGKKPYNPVLGELFFCSWRVSSDTNVLLHFVAEQVSRHPPVSALYVECPAKNMCLSGSLSARCIFTGMSVDVSFTGGLSLVLGSHKERYDLTLPTTHARSILSKPWVQLGGKVTISCPNTGLVATISHPKSFFGDKPHQVVGEVKDASGILLSKFQGDWKTHFKFTMADNTVYSLDVNDQSVFPKRVRKIDDQSPYESRKLWSNVNEALRQGNVTLAEEYRLRLPTPQEFAPVHFCSVPEVSGWCYRNPLVTL